MKYNVIGQRIPSIEALEKASGAGKYASDVVLPGMLWGKILRAPLPHARILNVDTTEANKLKGVRAILTATDCPDTRLGHMIPDETVLAIDKIRFTGDEIAAVAATDPDIAEEALELIKVEYDPLPAVGTTEEALAEGAPLVHEDKQKNIAMQGDMERGVFEKAWANTAHQIETTFQTSSAHQCYMEPMGCTADFSEQGKLTLHVGIQDPWIACQHYAEILGINESKIRIMHSFVGGGFGSKKMVVLHLIAALLSQKTKRPVRIDNTRNDEFMTTHPRVPMKIHFKLGADSKGFFTAKSSDVIADNGAYSNEAPAIAGIASYRMDNLYRIPNIKNRYRLIYTNKLPTGGYRGFGNPQGAFALESGIDMLAEKIAVDPAELRLKNFVRPGDLTMHGFRIGTTAVRECVENAKALTDWSKKRTTRNRKSTSGTSRKGQILKGIGMACCIHGSGFRGAYKDFDGSSAILEVNEKGRVYLLTGEPDIGQGSRTVLAQIAAEKLGIPISDIEVSAIDTDTNPRCLGAYASRVTTLGGHAVLIAAQKVQEKILSYAAEQLECAPEDLACSDGVIFLKSSPTLRTSFTDTVRDMVIASGGKPVVGKGNFVTPDDIVIPDETRYGHATMSYAFAAHVAEVSVDTETGRVKIENMTAIHDSGKIINPLTAEGQVEGGVVQGLGWALSEEMVFEHGQVLNPNFYDYRIPTVVDAPNIQVGFVDETEPEGPYGAKGLGEPSLVPTAASVANAIAHALGGRRIYTLPITSEKVIETIQTNHLVQQ